MKPWVRLLPVAVLLFILPFPGTVALRLLALAGALLVSARSWHKEGLPQIPAKAALLLWLACALFSLISAVDPAYSLDEITNEIGYAMVAYLGFLTLTRTRADAGLLVTALILGSLALAAFALWGYVFSDAAYWNEHGLAGGSGSYTTYLLALLPVLLWAGSALRHKHRWTLISGLIALQLVVAALAGQRAFWLAFALQALLAVYLLRARLYRHFGVARARNRRGCRRTFRAGDCGRYGEARHRWLEPGPALRDLASGRCADSGASPDRQGLRPGGHEEGVPGAAVRKISGGVACA